VSPPGGPATWQVQVTNTGDQADTFDLSLFGPLVAYAQLDQESLTLNPGESGTVQITVEGFTAFLAGDTFIGLHAQSRTQDHIQDEFAQVVTITEVEGVEVTWIPATKTIKDTLSTGFTVLITNTGNVISEYILDASSSPTEEITLLTDEITLPPNGTVYLFVQVTVPSGGEYELSLTATNANTTGSGTASLTVELSEPVKDTYPIYLPLVLP
jgi:uncharacterized membrane protein